MTGPLGLAFAALVAVLAAKPALSRHAGASIGDAQVAVLMSVDQGRSCGSQTMMARLQLGTVRAELERDRGFLEQNRQLYEKKAIPLIELQSSLSSSPRSPSRPRR